MEKRQRGRTKLHQFWKGHLWSMGPGVHAMRVLKINRSLGQYEQGIRYSIVVQKSINAMEMIKVVSPYVLPAMTLREFRREFDYIEGQQPYSTKATREKYKEKYGTTYRQRIKFE